MKEIFVVEDDQHIRELLEYLLINDNYSVHSFKNLKLFHQGLKKRRPHLILLDIMLPDGDGEVLCQELGESEETREIPVVLMSAHAGRRRFTPCHSKEFVRKPFEIKHLLQTIEKWSDFDEEHTATS